MSVSQDPYDPTAPEEPTSRGQYVTVRELKILGIAIVVLIPVMTPVYLYMKGNANKSLCTQNLKAIFEAVSLYATEHDGRYPPIARTETIGGIEPSLGDTGAVYTWASDASGYMSPRASFLCPSASPEEIVQTEDPKSGSRTIPMSYGMYAPYGGFFTALVDNPDETILIGETSNGGSHSSYDPRPFLTAAGAKLPDGFVIGWSDGNAAADDATRTVTRLAFFDTVDGVFKKDGPGRHGNTIHLLTASGERINATPEMALFHSFAKQVSTLWKVPPQSMRGR